MFSVDWLNPTDVKLIGKPVNSGGDFPASIAVHPYLAEVCVLNSGSTNGVACFEIDIYQGLVPLAKSFRSLNLTETSPPTGPPGTPSDIIFTGNGKHLLVSVKGNGAGINGEYPLCLLR